MIRTLDAILVVAVVAGAVWTYQIKHEAELSAERAASLQKKINREKERINLLEADWALFNNPARLQRLTEKFTADLRLKPLKPNQIATFDELPGFRPHDDPIGRLAETSGTVDASVTGSIQNQGGKKP